MAEYITYLSKKKLHSICTSNFFSESNSSSEEDISNSKRTDLNKLTVKEIHESFLYSCRNGELNKLEQLLAHCNECNIEINTSQKGR